MRYTEPVLREQDEQDRQTDTIRKLHESYKYQTVFEKLIDEQGRGDNADFSRLTESARRLLHLNKDDYVGFCHSFNRLDAVVEGAKLPLPSKAYYTLRLFTAPFAVIGRVCIRCKNRKDNASQKAFERRTTIANGESVKPRSTMQQIGSGLAWFRDSFPNFFMGWFGLTYFFVGMAQVNARARRKIKTRDINKVLRKECFHKIRHAYLRNESYGDLNKYAKNIDTFQSLPWVYNRWCAWILKCLSGDYNRSFGDKDQAVKEYLRQGQMSDGLTFADKMDVRDAYFRGENAIPNYWHYTWQATKKNLAWIGKWTFVIQSSTYDKVRERYKLMRTNRIDYLEKRKTLNSLDLGVRGLVKLRPSRWVNIWGLETLVGLTRIILYPVLWLFGVWMDGNPITLARRAYDVWKNDVDRMILTINARACEQRHGLAQFNAMVDDLLSGELNFDVPQGLRRVEDDSANEVRRLSKDGVDRFLATLRSRYGHTVENAKPDNERRQAYANIFYSLALTAPDILLRDNPLVAIPEWILDKLAGENSGLDGFDANVAAFSRRMVMHPKSMIKEIVGLLQNDLNSSQTDVSSDGEPESRPKSRLARWKTSAWKATQKIGSFLGRHILGMHFKKSVNDKQILYSHREFLDIVYDKSMYALASRIELLRSLEVRLETKGISGGQVIIHGRRFSQNAIKQCLGDTQAFIEKYHAGKENAVNTTAVENLISTKADDLGVALGEAMDYSAKLGRTAIDVTFKFEQKHYSNVNTVHTYTTTIAHRDAPCFIVYNKDLSVLTGLENPSDLNGLVSDSFLSEQQPYHLSSAEDLWKEQEPQVMQLHRALSKQLAIAVDWPESGDTINVQVLIDFCRDIQQRLVLTYEESQANQARFSLDGKGYGIQELLKPGFIASKAELKSAISKLLLSARDKGQRVLDLVLHIDGSDRHVCVESRVLTTPWDHEIKLHEAFAMLDENAKNEYLQAPDIANLLQGQGFSARTNTTGGGQAVTGVLVGQLKQADNREIIHNYNALMAMTKGLSQPTGDDEAREALVLFGVKSGSAQDFDALTRCFIRLYAGMRERNMSSIEFQFDIAPKMNQVIARLLNSRKINGNEIIVLRELQRRINLEDTTTVRLTFIEQMANLLHINLFQRQVSVIPVDDPLEIAKRVVQSVLSANIMLRWTNLDKPDALSTAAAVMAKPAFDIDQGMCLLKPQEDGFGIARKDLHDKIKQITYVKPQQPTDDLFGAIDQVQALFNLEDETNEDALFDGRFTAILKAYRSFICHGGGGTNETINAVIKALQVLRDDTPAQLMQLLNQVCMSQNFVNTLALVIKQLQNQAKPLNGPFIAFWKMMQDLLPDLNSELAFDSATSLAFSQDKTLTLRGVVHDPAYGERAIIAIGNGFRRTHKHLLKGQPSFTIVVPPAATQVIRAVVRPNVGQETISPKDAFAKALALLPYDFRQLAAQVKGKGVAFNGPNHPLVSYDNTNLNNDHKVFYFKFSGLADPSHWSGEGVTFTFPKPIHKQVPRVTNWDVHQLIRLTSTNTTVTMTFADGGEEQCSNDVNFELQARSTDLNPYLEITMSYPNIYAAQTAWRGQPVVNYLSRLLASQDLGRSCMRDFHVAELFAGKTLKMQQLLSDLLDILDKVDVIDNDFSARIFATIAKILPMVPEKSRALFYARAIANVMRMNQVWLEKGHGALPLELASHAGLLTLPTGVSTSKETGYKIRVAELLARSTGNRFDVNYDLRNVSTYLVAPRHMDANEQYLDFVTIAARLLDMLSKAVPGDEMGYDLHTPNIICDNVLEKALSNLTQMPVSAGVGVGDRTINIPGQILRHVLFLSGVIRKLGLSDSEDDFPTVLRKIEDMVGILWQAIPARKAEFFPVATFMVTLGHGQQLAFMKKAIQKVADHQSPLDKWAVKFFDNKVESELANRYALPKDASVIQIQGLLRLLPGGDGFDGADKARLDFALRISVLRYAFGLGLTHVLNTFIHECADITSEEAIKNGNLEVTTEALKVRVKQLVSPYKLSVDAPFCGMVVADSTNFAHMLQPYVKKAESALALSDSCSPTELSEPYAYYETVVMIAAHLGLTARAKALILKFINHVLSNLHYVGHANLTESQHPVRIVLRRWAENSILRPIIAVISQNEANDAISFVLRGIQDAVSRKAATLNIAQAISIDGFGKNTNQLMTIIFVGELLAASRTSPSDYLNPAARYGAKIVTTAMRYLLSHAGNSDYIKFIEDLGCGELRRNPHCHWVWGIVAKQYLFELKQLKQQADDGADASQLMEALKPFDILFTTLYEVMGAQSQADVAELGTLLMLTLMGSALSPKFPHEAAMIDFREGITANDPGELSALDEEGRLGKVIASLSLDNHGCHYHAWVSAAISFHRATGHARGDKATPLDMYVKPMLANLVRCYEKFGSPINQMLSADLDKLFKTQID